MTEHAFIAELEDAAKAAQRAEIAFRKGIAAEIARHERDRQFAFRRVDLASRMAVAAQDRSARDEAIAAQIAALRAELGWYGDTPERTRIIEAWNKVAEAIWRETHGGDGGKAGADAGAGAGAGASVAASMLAFEAWFETEFGKPFLELFDQEIEELPVVEF